MFYLLIQPIISENSLQFEAKFGQKLLPGLDWLAIVFVFDLSNLINLCEQTCWSDQIMTDKVCSMFANIEHTLSVIIWSDQHVCSHKFIRFDKSNTNTMANQSKPGNSFCGKHGKQFKFQNFHLEMTEYHLLKTQVGKR